MPAQSFQSRLQDRLDASLAAHGVPGAAVGVVRGPDRAVAASGFANMATGVNVTPDTLFQIGDISKVFTATLMMQLVHSGLVELDEPVRGALHEFRVADDTATLSITPRQLLSHTSGIEGDHFIDCGRNPDALWRYVSTLDEMEQVHAPDDLFSFCNAGYGVLGRLVEEATGDHFTRALLRRICRPLELRNTVTLLEHAIVHRVAAGHRQVMGGEPELQPWTLSRFNAPIGGILSTVDDVLTFAGLHLHGGVAANKKQVLPSKAISAMHEGEIEIPGTEDEWGLGLRTSDWGGVRVVGHAGDTVGQRAFLYIFPEIDAAAVVLTNSPIGVHVADDCMADICEFLGVSAAPPLVASRDAECHDAFTGIYERMHQRLAMAPGKNRTLRMTVIPDELLIAAGVPEQTLTLRPIDTHRYVTVDPTIGTTELVTLIDGDEDLPAYVHYGLRAHHLIS